MRPFSRGRLLLGVFAFGATSALLLASVIDPYSGAVADPYRSSPYAPVSGELLTSATQALSASGEYENTIAREGYDAVLTPKPTPTPTPTPEAAAAPGAAKAKGAPAEAKKAAPASAPNAAPPNAGSAQAIAFDMVAARGWGNDQYSCLVALWNRESGWRYNAANPSGAYGIPQALPGRKMASAGADWQTNPATQITWGLGYITGRYGSPCGAWAKSQAVGWY